MTTISVPKAILSQIETHARREQPRECCGVLGGRGNEVFSCYPLRNLSAEAETRFFAAPEDLFQAMQHMDAAGEELLAIYHSHPHGPVEPSSTDIDLALYPEAVCLIASFTHAWEMRAFRIRDRTVTEVAIQAVEMPSASRASSATRRPVEKPSSCFTTVSGRPVTRLHFEFLCAICHV